MGELEQLDVIKIEDKYGLSEEEIRVRVSDIAAEKSTINGWQILSIKKMENHTVKIGEYIRHEYEILGKADAASSESESKNTSYGQSPDDMAAKPIDVEL